MLVCVTPFDNDNHIILIRELGETLTIKITVRQNL